MDSGVGQGKGVGGIVKLAGMCTLSCVDYSSWHTIGRAADEFLTRGVGGGEWGRGVDSAY